MGEYARRLAQRFKPPVAKALKNGNKPDKGLRDGSCNRTACQTPLAGLPRWSMHNYMTGGRLYYCPRCASDFNAWDRRIREPLRCSIIPEDDQ